MGWNTQTTQRNRTCGQLFAEPHRHTHLTILTHSCHGRTDRFLTRGFNSNHINPPLGTVGVSTRQALSQPLCCLGSVLVYKGTEGEQERNGDEWMTAMRSKMSLCSFCLPFCKKACLWAQNQTVVSGKVHAISSLCLPRFCSYWSTLLIRKYSYPLEIKDFHSAPFGCGGGFIFDIFINNQ